MGTAPLPSWVALADAGPVTALAEVAGGRTFQATSDPAAFAELLRMYRPRIAILGTPPAGAGDLESALNERRRRPSMRGRGAGTRPCSP